MQLHNSVHNSLIIEWAKVGTLSPLELERIARYMGLFEKIYLVMIDNGICSLKLFDQMYGHRIAAIVSNPVVRSHMLHDIENVRGPSWKEFKSLVRDLSKGSQGPYYRLALKRFNSSEYDPDQSDAQISLATASR